jgi:hypothetical protein
MPRENDYIRGNENLKKAHATMYVDEETHDKYTAELIKCKEDIIYFAEKYFTIISPGQGKHIIKLYKKQKQLLRAMVNDNRVIALASRQTGKCVSHKSFIKVRNKQTGAIEELTIGEFHDKLTLTV